MGSTVGSRDQSLQGGGLVALLSRLLSILTMGAWETAQGERSQFTNMVEMSLVENAWENLPGIEVISCHTCLL